ncbi:MAG TPA: hypothetical protein VD793_09565, partial [Gemmatimonadales bacterium]|nr:hypothetical protein [Gemmatimonadales bacterium]
MQTRSPRRFSHLFNRLARGTLLLLLAAGVSTCELDKLVTTPEPGTFAVAPAQVQDSAAVGSMASRIRTIQITISTGAGNWSLNRAQGSAWLVPTPTNGAAPATVEVTLSPAGLAAGLYQDTLVVASAEGSGDPTRVPVQFVIYPCLPETVTADTAVQDTLNTGDCGYAARPGRFARIYRFSGAANDSVSIWLVSGAFAPRVILDSVPPGTAALGDATGCPNLPATACIRYLRLPRGGTYGVAAATADSGSVGAYSLEIRRPRPPAPAAMLAQLRADSVTAVAGAGAIPETSLVFRAALTDPDPGDQLVLEVEVQPVGSPFTGTPTGTSAPTTSGLAAVVAVTGLSDNVAYRWRARARDHTGRSGAWVEFGPDGDAGADFRVSVPEAPTGPTELAQLKSDGLAVIAIGATTDERAVVFSGRLGDPDPGDLLRMEVEVRPVGSAFTGSPVATSVEVGNGALASVTVAGLADETGFHWQARTVDGTGRASPWASFGGNAETAADFRVSEPAAPDQPAGLSQFRSDGTTPLAVGATSPEATVVVSAAVSDPDPGSMLKLQVELRPTAAAYTGVPTDSSAAVPGGSTAQVTVSSLADDTDYRWRARAVDQTGRAGSWVEFGANGAAERDFRVAVPAVDLAFLVQPGGAAAGSALSPAVQVVAREAGGITDLAFTGMVTVTVQGDAAPLQGTTAVAAVGGVAEFPDLVLASTGTFRLVASAAGLPNAVSDQFTITPGAASKV